MVAVLESPFVGLLVPHVTADGQLKTVALLNVRIDAQGPVSLRLRGISADARHATWHELRRSSLELPLCFKDGCYHVVIPEISAWNGGYLDFQ